MDPKSVTKTSFCNIEIDNVTENTSKKYILEQLKILCNIKYNDRYAKIYNEKFKNNLNNIHLISLKSIGNPYLLFITQISSLNYAFLIDKKVKEGYQYPKIFILPYNFQSEIYKKHSLFECELIRTKDNQWILSIGDVYYLTGMNMKKTVIIDRINQINNFLEDNLLESNFNQTCHIQIKRYFDYKDYQMIMNNFIPKLSYKIRGVYLIPMKVEYSNILYLFPKDFKINKEYLVFRILQTLKPDVYELYLKNNDSIQKIGNALVQTIKNSHNLVNYFKEDEEVYVKCKLNKSFNKWEPFEKTNELISSINDL